MTIATDTKQETYNIVMNIGIKECDGSRTLLRPKEFSARITPAAFKFSSNAALMVRCENMALQEYAKQFQTDLDNDASLGRLLAGHDWTFFHKTLTFKKAPA